MAAFQLVITTLGFLATLYMILVIASVNRRNKTMDVVIACSKMYDDLRRDMRVAPVEDTAADPASWRRYWGLKNDQFDFWLAGYVDPETICSWMHAVVVMKCRHKTQMELAWQNYSRDYAGSDPVFIGFVGRLLRINMDTDAKEDVDRVYREVIDVLVEVEEDEKPFIALLYGAPLLRIILREPNVASYRALVRKVDAKKRKQNGTFRR